MSFRIINTLVKSLVCRIIQTQNKDKIRYMCIFKELKYILNVLTLLIPLSGVNYGYFTSSFIFLKLTLFQAISK